MTTYKDLFIACISFDVELRCINSKSTKNKAIEAKTTSITFFEPFFNTFYAKISTGYLLLNATTRLSLSFAIKSNR